jgi:hypothetical protein
MRKFVLISATVGAMLLCATPARADDRVRFLDRLDKMLSEASARDGQYSDTTAALHILWSMSPDERESRYNSYVQMCRLVGTPQGLPEVSNYYAAYVSDLYQRKDLSNSDKGRFKAFHLYAVTAAELTMCPTPEVAPKDSAFGVTPMIASPVIETTPVVDMHPEVSESVLMSGGRFVLTPK